MSEHDVFLKKIGSFDVKVSKWNGGFYAYENGAKQSLYNAKTLEELEAILKRHASNKRHFKPINVIHIDDDQVGRITSQVADRDNHVYFTWKKRPDLKAQRSEERLEKYSYGRKEQSVATFAKATPANLKILENINTVEDHIKTLRASQDFLRKQYVDLVTVDDIDKEGES